MRLARVQEIKEIEIQTCRKNHLDIDQLMNQAGMAMASWIQKWLSKQKKYSRVCICVGPGHNGGDGLVVAQNLYESGIPVRIFYFQKTESSELWHEKFSECYSLKMQLEHISKITELQFFDDELIVDALFGVGLNRPLEGLWVEIIQFLNEVSNSIISLDVPSGLDADCGWPLPVAIRADYTLTCQIAKTGFFLNYGSSHVGRLRVLDVGFDQEIISQVARTHRLVTPRAIAELFPKRSPLTHKAKQGHLLVIAGSSKYPGALQMVCEAAIRLGVGYVSYLSDISIGADFLPFKKEDFFRSDLKKFSAVVIGPGLNLSEDNIKILEHLRKNHKKVLVDADALTSLSQSHLQNIPPDWLLTPHAGELSRLIKISSQEIEYDRLKSVSEVLLSYRCHVLLKGFRTVVACWKGNSEQRKYIIGAGNSSLAKAGSGDVLSGFISSLMAQGLSTDESAVLGALIHGCLADRWVKEGLGDFSLKASDLFQILPWIVGLTQKHRESGKEK